MPAPPYTIRSERLVVRCWQPSDAAELRDVLASSREHLLPWLPWAEHEPQTLEEKLERMRIFRGNFDLGKDFVYGIFDATDGSIVGGTGLHPRIGPGACEIGYWIRKEAVGRGFATEAAAVVARAGFEIARFERIEVRCEPHNEPSLRVARAIGFKHEGCLRGVVAGSSVDAPRRDLEIYGMLAGEFGASAASRFDATFEDAIGNRLSA